MSLQMTGVVRVDTDSEEVQTTKAEGTERQWYGHGMGSPLRIPALHLPKWVFCLAMCWVVVHVQHTLMVPRSVFSKKHLQRIVV